MSVVEDDQGEREMTAEQALNLRINTLIMRGLDAAEAQAQAQREAIREHAQRRGFDRAADRYGEPAVRAAFIPED